MQQILAASFSRTCKTETLQLILAGKKEKSGADLGKPSRSYLILGILPLDSRRRERYYEDTPPRGGVYETAVLSTAWYPAGPFCRRSPHRERIG